MKSSIDRRFVIAVLAIACLTTVLLIVIPTRSSSPGPGEYDPWLDWNDDGKIDMKDIGRVSKAFGTSGQNISKASLEYDSGWVDITGMAGQNITMTHGLNITDWNDENIDVSIIGKTSPEGELQRYLGLTGRIQGWNKTYGGTGWDYAFSLVRTGDGGYALGGFTYSVGAGGEDFWLVKIDVNGNAQWNKTYGGTDEDGSNDLVQTDDGGYALAGLTDSFGAGGSDFWLVKTDVNGNAQWNKTYGGAEQDVAEALMQAADDGYAIAGYTNSFGAGSTDAWLIKTDASGNVEWNKTYGGTSEDSAHALVRTGDGGYALGGFTYSIGAGKADFWLVKTDVNGSVQWNKTYGGTDFDEALALVQTADGGYALAGRTWSLGAGGSDFWLVKADANGNAQWSKTYGGTNDDRALSVVQTDDGGYALAGLTYSFGAGSSDAWLIKTDSNCDMQWNKTCGGTGWEEAHALIRTDDGEYAMGGFADSFGAGGFDAWLVKTDAESGLAWVDSSANTITLYRGATDAYWNFVRLRLWKPR